MQKIPSPELAYTGTQVNYYPICRRKLWLFSWGL
jgi:CRISPR/Cas system-associated exonuclease Cas4 (RecB family)